MTSAVRSDQCLYMAAIAPDMSRTNEFQSDRDSFFATAIRQWPELADLMATAKRVGPLRVFTKWHGYFRQSAGPGWVLVGDAGHFKDFSPGQGISDALRQARQLADGIEHGPTVEGRKASLSESQASELSARIAGGESVTALAREFGVSRQTVYNYVA